MIRAVWRAFEFRHGHIEVENSRTKDMLSLRLNGDFFKNVFSPAGSISLFGKCLVAFQSCFWLEQFAPENRKLGEGT